MKELGWDTHSPVHVVPEHRVDNLKVDIALCNLPKEPVIFIEIKAPGKCSPKGQDQVFEYSARQGGIPMIIFTDGNKWHFYNSYGSGAYDSKKVKSIQLTKDDIDECIECFSRYLQYEEVKTDQAFDNLRRDYEQVRSANKAKSKIPEAWKRLVDGEDMLIELIIEQVKEISDGGHAPKKADVVAFLKALGPITKPRTTVTLPSESSPPVTYDPSDRIKTNYQYKINGEIQQAESAIEIYREILDYILTKYRRIEELKKLDVNKSTSKRFGNGHHISDNKKEIAEEDNRKKQLPDSKIWINNNMYHKHIPYKLNKIGKLYNKLEGKKILDKWGSGAEVEFDIPTRPPVS